MSVAELKRAVDQLPVEGRLELVEHIQQGFQAEDVALHAEIGRRLDEIKLLAGLRTAREQASKRQGTAAEHARGLVSVWAAR